MNPKDQNQVGTSLWTGIGRLGAWLDAHPRPVLLLILLLTLGLGVVKLSIDPPSPEFNWENRWWQIALNVERGEGYLACKPLYFPFCGPDNQVTAMREPLPVLVFAAVARLTGESLLAAAASGVLLNLFTIIVVYILAKDLSSTRTGLLAALLWATYLAPVRLYYSQISGDLLATLLLTVGLVLLMRARQTDRRVYWLSAGVTIGLAILSRSAVLMVALALTAGLVLQPHAPPRRIPNGGFARLRPALLFAAAWFLVLAPWLVRNGLVFGRPVIGSTLSGYYLYRQNYHLSSDSFLRFVSGGEFEAVQREMLARRADLRGTENEAEMDLVYREEALRVIRAEPVRYVALSAYRLLMLWFNWGVNEVYGKSNTIVDNLILLQQVFFLGLGILGAVGRWRQVWPLVVTVVSFSLLYMGVMAHLPYIIPVVPALAALSALALNRIGRRIENLLAHKSGRIVTLRTGQ